jgi:uncharacterized membrane protein
VSASSLSSPSSPSNGQAQVAAAAWLGGALRGAGVLLGVSPFLPRLLELAGKPALAETFDQIWVPMCHRMPERSLSLGGEVMPLCSRCLGLVEGMSLGLLVAWPALSVRALRIWLSLAFAFLFVEMTTQDLGWHPVFHPTRLLSGFLVAFPIGAVASALARRAPNALAPSSLLTEGPPPRATSSRALPRLQGRCKPSILLRSDPPSSRAWMRGPSLRPSPWRLGPLQPATSPSRSDGLPLEVEGSPPATRDFRV